VEGPAQVVQLFDCEAIPLPPGTKARPRPPGRERHKTTPAHQALPANTQTATTLPPQGNREELALGDIVALRSGGPPMTIVGFTEETEAPAQGLAAVWQVKCAWFHEGDYRVAVLPGAALVLLPRGGAAESV
jgi:uncharacterized protein YodC (DUF2158 family)